MVIKVVKKDGLKNRVTYKSTKTIITPQDAKRADKFDDALNKTIKDIEKVLLERKMLSKQLTKTDPLKAWYLIGNEINQFIKNKGLPNEDEALFWDYLYGRSSLINKEIPKNKVGKTRNDFRIASKLARSPFKKIKKIRLWALWREVLTSKAFDDVRVLNFIIARLEQHPPKSRDSARPFLKAVSKRLKRIDTSVLGDRELAKKLRDTLA